MLVVDQKIEIYTYHEYSQNRKKSITYLLFQYLILVNLLIGFKSIYLVALTYTIYLLLIA